MVFKPNFEGSSNENRQLEVARFSEDLELVLKMKFNACLELTRVDPLPQSSSGNPPGLKDHTKCFIFLSKMFAHFLKSKGVQRLKCLISIVCMTYCLKTTTFREPSGTKILSS